MQQLRLSLFIQAGLFLGSVIASLATALGITFLIISAAALLNLLPAKFIGLASLILPLTATISPVVAGLAISMLIMLTASLVMGLSMQTSTDNAPCTSVIDGIPVNQAALTTSKNLIIPEATMVHTKKSRHQDPKKGPKPYI